MNPDLPDRRSTRPDDFWEAQYQQHPDLWGVLPSPELIFASRFSKVGRALDIGAGEGRNSLFLLERGYSVDAVDISLTALERLEVKHHKWNQALNCFNCELSQFKLEPDTYSLIVADSVLNFVSRMEQRSFFRKAVDGLVSGGILVIVGFSEAEFSVNPAYSSIPIFREDLESLNCHLQLLRFSQALGIDESHGFPHYHNQIIYIGRKSEIISVLKFQ
jgi:SAM-dependent methyltransferase